MMAVDFSVDVNKHDLMLNNLCTFCGLSIFIKDF